MPSFDGLRRFVDGILDAAALRDRVDPNGVWRSGPDEVAAIGLLLEASDHTSEWIVAEGLDALIVHRPWGLSERLPGNPGVLAYHLAFDERLTLGMNPLLAEVLGMIRLKSIGQRDGRPLGMIGAVEPQEMAGFAVQIEQQFGQVELLPVVDRQIRCVAVVGAMWPELVAEAAVRGADVYLTGEVRERGLRASAASGVSVASVGHRAAELWGLRKLAELLAERFPDARIVLAPDMGSATESTA